MTTAAPVPTRKHAQIKWNCCRRLDLTPNILNPSTRHKVRFFSVSCDSFRPPTRVRIFGTWNSSVRWSFCGSYFPFCASLCVSRRFNRAVKCSEDVCQSLRGFFQITEERDCPGLPALCLNLQQKILLRLRDDRHNVMPRCRIGTV